MDEHCLLSRSDAVRQMANLVLQKGCQNQGNPRTVGQQWVHTFVRRHEALNRDIIINMISTVSTSYISPHPACGRCKTNALSWEGGNVCG